MIAVAWLIFVAIVATLFAMFGSRVMLICPPSFTAVYFLPLTHFDLDYPALLKERFVGC